MKNEELILEAKKAREKSYSPYSRFQVGAALLTKDGKIYHGCNVENSAYSPTNCAERTAFFKAISEGERKFAKIAIVGGMEGTTADDLCAPCGVCRQVMAEFCKLDEFEIVMCDGQGGTKVVLLRDMLPYSFSL